MHIDHRMMGTMMVLFWNEVVSVIASTLEGQRVKMGGDARLKIFKIESFRLSFFFRAANWGCAFEVSSLPWIR